MKGFGQKIAAFVFFYLLINGLIYWLLTAISPPQETGLWLKNLAVTLIISWVIILVIYYIWAIYFYNLNYGWSDKDWEEAEAKKALDPYADTGEPLHNPNENQTLGLPPGTVRGTLAMSLMIGGLSMTIIAISMPETLDENEFFVDNFDFLKSAFLMMIAFYFGNKSLESLSGGTKTVGAQMATPKSNPASETSPAVAPAKGASGAKSMLAAGDLSDKEDDSSSDKTDFGASPAVG